MRTLRMVLSVPVFSVLLFLLFPVSVSAAPPALAVVKYAKGILRVTAAGDTAARKDLRHAANC